MHELLLRKSDGTMMLVIWNERVKGEDKVTVSFGTKMAKGKVFDPTVGVEPKETREEVDSLGLIFTDHPLVLEFGKI